VSGPSIAVDPAWRLIGETSNAWLYEIREDVIAVVPHPDCHDTEATARESLALQERHWKQAGRRGGTVVFMDPVLEQDAGSRAVYANETAGIRTTCFALVGATFFAQVTSSVYAGMSRPAVPTQVFKSLEEALAWVAQVNRQRGQPG